MPDLKYGAWFRGFPEGSAVSYITHHRAARCVAFFVGSTGIPRFRPACRKWMAAVRFGRWFSRGVQPVEADLAEYRAQAAVNSYVVKCIGADKSQQGDGYRMTQQSDAVAEAHTLWQVLPIQE